MSQIEPLEARRPPRGDGHCVLLLPGFATGDFSNATLASVVRTNGCRPKKWRLGSNEGPTSRIIEGISERLGELYERDHRTVTVVGMSLGGVYARRLGRLHPEMVRQVITIGSPIRFGGEEKSGLVGRLWKRREHKFDDAALEEINLDEAAKPLLEVPSSSIYSRLDDIVPWNKSLEAPGAQCENIGVRGANHLGLLLHPGVHFALADRIRRPEGEWQPFVPPLASRMLFESPVFFDSSRVRIP